MKEIKTISIIGAGCVANFFGREMKRKGYEILEIISRNEERGEVLAEAVGASLNINNFDQINQNADLYILFVGDRYLTPNVFPVFIPTMAYICSSNPSSSTSNLTISSWKILPREIILRVFGQNIIRVNNTDESSDLFKGWMWFM